MSNLPLADVGPYPIDCPVTYDLSGTSELFPTISGLDTSLSTVALQNPRTVFLDPRLRTQTNTLPILQHVARISDSFGPGDSPRRLFVEPGVGRTCLLNDLEIHGDKRWRNFALSGVGKTFYCNSNAFPLRGDAIDGLCSLEKVLHRAEIAETLASHGCRVPLTAAILRLHNVEKRTVHGTYIPAALLLRASRSVLRIQQLDPLHGFTHTKRLLGNVFANLVQDEIGSELRDTLFGAARYATRHWRLRTLTRLNHSALFTGRLQRLAVGLRVKAIDRYATALLLGAKSCVESELAVQSGSLSIYDFVMWFAAQLGRQLAIFRELGLIFDYRIVRNHLYARTMHESQLSLLAEFHDLETAAFVGGKRSSAIYISESEFTALGRNFAKFHLLEVNEALGIVKTLALISSLQMPEEVDAVMWHFCEAYNGLA